MQLYRVTLYRDDSVTRIVYDNVKHLFWTAKNTILVLAIVENKKTGAHSYVNWMREQVCWYRVERA